MTSISKEDYQKLLEELADQQYSMDEEVDINQIPDDSWIPSESFAKEKMKQANQSGIIDVTKFRKDKIQEALYKYINIKIGIFLIRIDTYHGYPDKTGKGVNLTMDIGVWETKLKTPSGNPCKMEYRINLHKDNRFTNRPWLVYFNDSGEATHMPVETVVDVVRWLQALKRMNAFL